MILAGAPCWRASGGGGKGAPSESGMGPKRWADDGREERITSGAWLYLYAGGEVMSGTVQTSALVPLPSGAPLRALQGPDSHHQLVLSSR